MGSGFWGFFKNNNKLISYSFSSQAKAILILTFLLGCWRDTLPLPCQLPMNSNHSFTGFCSALTSSQAHVNTTGLISRGTERMKSNAKSQWQTDNKCTRRQNARILMLLIYLFIPLTGIRQKTLAFLEETTWKPQCVCWSSIQTMCQLTACSLLWLDDVSDAPISQQRKRNLWISFSNIYTYLFILHQGLQVAFPTRSSNFSDTRSAKKPNQKGDSLSSRSSKQRSCSYSVIFREWKLTLTLGETAFFSFLLLYNYTFVEVQKRHQTTNIQYMKEAQRQQRSVI